MIANVGLRRKGFQVAIITQDCVWKSLKFRNETWYKFMQLKSSRIEDIYMEIFQKGRGKYIYSLVPNAFQRTEILRKFIE